MKFRTEIFFEKNETEITYSDYLMTIGSCFAENIGELFWRYKFNILKNPFGVLYNPVSIYNALKAVKEKKIFTKDDLVFDQSEWHSFYFHSDFSSHDSSEALSGINNAVEETGKYLSKTNTLLITFGTAYVYRHREKNIIVSNCHKIPQNEFEHFMLSKEETAGYIKNILKLTRDFNPDITVVFTVSPVRHWKNGAVENMLSKSTLIVALHEAIKKEENAFYFPSFEIVMDDLRDYRYYAEDLLHPNSIALEYIGQKFISAYFSEETIKIKNQVEKILKAASHRPRNSNSEKHQQFVENQLRALSEFQALYPGIDLFEIQKSLEAQIC